MKVTVSMITLNEERAVAKVVEDIRRVVPGAEIFLVDSSSDRTAQIAQQLGCRVFKQFPPKGYGPAMDRAVRDARGDVVVTLDCDDTYPVEEIPRLVSMIEDGWDLDWSEPGVIAHYCTRGREVTVGAGPADSMRLADDIEVQPR